MTRAGGAALAVMAQVPRPGRVKTRLGTHLTPRQSADLYTAFLLDTLDLAKSVKGCTPFLAFAPPDGDEYFAGIAPVPFRLFPQTDGDLGRRMLHVFLQLEQWGYSPIVLVGSDIPALQPERIEEAIDYLDSADICLGPSTDGGYFLVGARTAHPGLFEGIPWSTQSVLTETIARADESNLSVALLEPGTDVDTIEDLLWLRSELERFKQTTGARIPRRTDAFLARMSL